MVSQAGRLRAIGRAWLAAIATIAWCAAINATPPEAGAPVKLALVSAYEGEAASQTLDLCAARLAAEPGVRLVERREIATVFAEQRLQLLVGDAAEAARLGSVLGADLFAVLEMSGDGQSPVGLVVYETASTRRLADASTRGGVEDAAADVAAAVRQALRARRGDGGPTLAIVARRSADLPPTYDSVLDGWLELWQRRLLAAGRVTLLERSRLEHLIREKDLAAVTAGPRHSVALVEAEISRGKAPGRIALALRLTDARGAVLTKLRAEADEAAGREIVDALVAGFDEWLGGPAAVAPAAATPLEQEANRFYEEGSRFVMGPYVARSVPAAEAAYALAPTPRHRKLLAAALLWSAQRRLGGEFRNPWVRDAEGLDPVEIDATLPLVRRSIALSRLNLERADSSNHGSYRRHVWVGANMVNHGITGYLDALNRAALTPEIRRERDAFKQEVLAYWTLADAQALAWVERRPDLWPAYLERRTYREREGLHVSTGAAQRSAEQVALWLPVLQRLEAEPNRAVPAKALLGLDAGLQWLHHTDPRKWLAFGGETPKFWGAWTWRERAEALEPVYEALRKHPWPVLNWHARLAAEADALRSDFPAPSTKSERDRMIEEGARRYSLFATELSAWLATLPDGDTHSQIMGCLLWRDAIPILLGGDAARAPEINRVAACMLERRIILGEVITDLMTNVDRRGPNHTPQAAELVAEAMRLADRGEARVTVGWGEVRRAVCVTYLAGSPHKAETVRTMVLGGEPKRLLGGGDLVKGGHLADLHAVGDRLVAIVADSATSRPPVWTCFVIPLRGAELGGPLRLGRLQLQKRPGAPIDFEGGGAASVAIAADTVFVATYYEGLLAFPLDGGPPRRVGAPQGLPSDCVTAVAALGGKLFLGAGVTNGFLLRFDPASGEIETIASSQRQERRTPLDGEPGGFTVHGLLPTPDGSSLIASVAVARKQSGATHPSSGLWRLDPATGTLTQLVNARGGHRLGWIEPGKTILADGWWTSFSFDTAGGKASLCRVSDWKGPRAEDLGLGLAGQTAKVSYTRHTRDAFLIEPGRLLSSDPFGVHDLATGEFFPMPWSGRKIANVIPSKRVLLLGPGRLLVMIDNALWLVDWTMPPAATQPMPEQSGRAG